MRTSGFQMRSCIVRFDAWRSAKYSSFAKARTSGLPSFMLIAWNRPCGCSTLRAPSTSRAVIVSKNACAVFMTASRSADVVCSAAIRIQFSNMAIPLNYTNVRTYTECPPLRDRIKPGVRVLFVGINPGVRSALTGHHFAGFSNHFWKLLYESRLVPEPITYEDDDRLAEFHYGITNICARATTGIDTLEPHEYVEG